MIQFSDITKQGIELIPCTDLVIDKRNDTVAYDFTVDDYYTFMIDGGVYVQDCMALYVPVTKESEEDIKEKIFVTKNLRSPANGEVTTEPSQDIVLGIYSLTVDGDDKIEYTKTIGDKVYKSMVTKGQAIFNDLLPADLPYIVDFQVTKKKLSMILNRISIIEESRLVDVLNKIKTYGLSRATTYGFTLGFGDLYNPNLIKLNRELLSGEQSNDSKVMATNLKLKDTLNGLNIATFIESGARGSWDQAKQLVFSRGYVADHTNMIRPTLIRSSLVEGLDPKEFFNSCYGARKGLLDTAVSTGTTGHLTRQLVYSCHACELDEQLTDCGTNKHMKLKLLVTNDDGTPDIKATRKLIVSLSGRKYKLDTDEQEYRTIIGNDSSKDHKLIGKTIFLRTPIYCKSEKVCQTCYGDRFDIVRNQIGVVATQTMGERLTQLVLRTFHLGGVATSNLKDDSNDDIIKGINVVNKFFHKTSEICSTTEPETAVMGLHNLFINYGVMYLVHIEVVVSCMMWTKDNTKWRIQPDRDTVDPIWVSILKIPSLESWIIGCAFSNLKSKLLSGLSTGEKSGDSSISRIFKY